MSSVKATIAFATTRLDNVQHGAALFGDEVPQQELERAAAQYSR